MRGTSVRAPYANEMFLQAWGFEQIDGVRRYARHVRFSHNNDEEIHEIKLYYDYGQFFISAALIDSLITFSNSRSLNG